MKTWTKSKFYLTDTEGFTDMVNARWGDYAAKIMLEEVRFPIQITNCNRFTAYAFTDAMGREYDAESFNFHPSEKLFDITDRMTFFKKVNMNSQKPAEEVNAELEELREIKNLLDNAHLLQASIRVQGTIAENPGQLLELLRRARVSHIDYMERVLASTQQKAAEQAEQLRLLKGE